MVEGRVRRFQKLPGAGTAVPVSENKKKSGSGSVPRILRRTGNGSVKVSDRYEIFLKNLNYLMIAIKGT